MSPAALYISACNVIASVFRVQGGRWEFLCHYSLLLPPRPFPGASAREACLGVLPHGVCRFDGTKACPRVYNTQLVWLFSREGMHF